MKIIILFISLYFTNTMAGEKVVETQADNYIARGYSENTNKEHAKSDACNSAKKELITFVFGASFQINQNMIRSLGVMDYSQDVTLNTGEVFLRTAMTETNTNDTITKCVITYPLQEAIIEKERLKSAQNNKSIRFTEIGDAQSMKGGVLEIVTIPADTDVLIDNVRWGSTPLRLYGKLEVGTHTIRLDNPNYKIIEESFVIGNATKTRIEKILKRATAKLNILSDPENATVKINEEVVGSTPINNIELIAGQKLKIEVTHPETETNIQYVTLIRDETKTLNQKLLLKPGFISLNVIPSKDVVITIDNVKRATATTNSWIQLEAGPHEISVSAKDYSEHAFSIDLRGGEKQAVATIKLTSLKEIKEKEYVEEKRLTEENEKRRIAEQQNMEREDKERRERLTSTHLLLGLETNMNVPKYKEPSYGFLVGIQESFFSNVLGIQIVGSFGTENREEKYNNSSNTVGKPNTTEVEYGIYAYYGILASLPIYIGNFYLNPGYGIRYDETTEETTTYNSRGTSTNNTIKKKIITKRKFYSYSAGFIYPKNDLPSYGSIYIEGGINKYDEIKSYDTTIKIGYRWNFK